MKKIQKTLIEPVLVALADSTAAQWGKMKPQEMIEHLEMSLFLSYQMTHSGKKKPSFKQKVMKWLLFNVVKGVPKNTPSVLYAKGRPPLRHANLEEAKKSFLANIQMIEGEMAKPENQGKEFFNPFLGKLNLEEFEAFNLIHFKHHFKQFGLV